MTYIKFEVCQNTWSTGGRDPEDSWSRDSSDGEVSIKSAIKVPEDGYEVLAVEQDVAIGTVVYLVWAQYTTGDSFGSDGGQYELLEVHLNRDDAEKRRTYFENVTHDGTYGSTGAWLPWFGYFEHLDGVYVSAQVLT